MQPTVDTKNPVNKSKCNIIITPKNININDIANAIANSILVIVVLLLYLFNNNIY